jgi:hypothetical protein
MFLEVKIIIFFSTKLIIESINEILELLKIVNFLQDHITGSKFSKYSSVHFLY